MRHIVFRENPNGYKVAILIKEANLGKADMLRYYVEPLEQLGIPLEDVIAFSLDAGTSKAISVKTAKAHLALLLPELNSLRVETLLVCDGTYFKQLTKSRTAEPHHGYVLPCAVDTFEYLNIILSANYKGIFYNPEAQTKITMSLETLASHVGGTHQVLGEGIVHSESYPESLSDIASTLASLHQYPMLTADLEAFSLKFYEAGIGTIAFAWDEHNGVSFACDYKEYGSPITDPCWGPGKTFYGFKSNNQPVKKLFREFLQTYQGTLIWHNANYDAKVCIYELWMDDPLDQVGMLKGMEIMTARLHDTQIISYLATNSTAGNKLSLKHQAHEFAGNYAQDDIKDICLIPLPDLLRYNLVDCLATWFVYKKNYPIMIADQQERIYDEIMIPSVKVILQMELTGMPMVPENIAKSRAELEALQQQYIKALFAEDEIKDFEKTKKMLKLLLDNQHLKTKKRTMDELDNVVFNPGSTKDLQALLYEHMGYPVIDKTDTKLPATGAKTIKKLSFQAKSDQHTRIFDALIGLSKVNIILANFITAFEERSLLKADGRTYLHGSFKLGGTVSGRLSSSKPNLMNQPAGGTPLAKYTKSCFVAPKGWLMYGADFSSLEDRISALLTKDPAKLKVYLDGFDGHCLRAYSYFGDKMADIANTVASINSIESKYPQLRQDSKAPTFLLTYGGTYHGLVSNVGLSEDAAKAIESAYHKMYTVSDNWVAGRIKQASTDGYVTAAFGLRVRTPILAATILGNSKTPYEAQAEGRTAGNALGQSWGMLNNRAGIEFQRRCLASPYRNDIKPNAHIHDAQYGLVRDDAEVIKWLNDNLTDCMKWQDDPEISHPGVKLGGDMDILFPDMTNKVTFPNGASVDEIRTLACDAYDKYMEKK